MPAALASPEAPASPHTARPDALTRRSARLVTAVLGFDALCHLYWLTGATWPAGDTRALSVAVLGFQTPFTVRVLVPLAVLLASGAAAVHIRSGARPRVPVPVQRLAHIATVAVAAATAVQVPLRLAWALGFGTDLDSPFGRLNQFVYLPLCALMALAAYRVARRGRPVRWRRRTAVAVPAVLALLLTGLAYGPMPAVDSAYAPPADSRYVDTPLARFHYLREGSGPPLVLLPGGTAWTFAWGPQLKALSANRTVYVVDLPGQGYTRPHDTGFAYDLPAMDAAIGAFLDAVGLDRTDLAGHSWSGGWALSYAQNHPARIGRLVLLAPSGLDEPDVLSWRMLKIPAVGEVTVKYGYTESAVRDSVKDLFVHKELATKDVQDAMWAPFADPENRRSVYLLERGLDWSVTEKAMPATVQPVLLLWGEEDTVLSVEQAPRYAGLLPSARLETLPSCGHALTLDCPGEVTSRMAAFLA